MEHFSNDSEFAGIETWLLDTGDLSSMGDESSINTAYQWLAEFQTILNAKNLFYLYGNHDAWPEKFPFNSTNADLVRHRNKMRTDYFPDQWPQGPLSIAIPHTQSRLLLYGVNSAIDDSWYNSFALGKVGIDPNWASAGGVRTNWSSLRARWSRISTLIGILGTSEFLRYITLSTIRRPGQNTS